MKSEIPKKAQIRFDLADEQDLIIKQQVEGEGELSTASATRTS
jgi:hypothetical protein